MNRIVFIRHGETDMAGRFCGRSDPVLNPAGVSQVNCLAEQAAMLGIERIYSSDLRRASQTAMIPDEAERWLREFPLHTAPGGESYAEFTARIDAVIAPFLETTAATTTAIVTHRGVMRYALTRFFSISEQEAWEKTAPYCATVVAAVRTRNCEVLS
jgi:broad specificity phosphatase PhoE